MSNSTFHFVAFIALFTICTFTVHHFSATNSLAKMPALLSRADEETGSYISRTHEEHVELLRLISHHNETLYKLLLSRPYRDKSLDEVSEIIASKDREIKKLMSQLDTTASTLADKNKEVLRLNDLSTALSSKCNKQPIDAIQPPTSDNILFPMPMTSMEKECDIRYGNGLLNAWRNSREKWCDADDSAASPAEIVCYPYHQHHKQLDGRPPDVFCEAKNLFIDFSKISSPDSAHKTSAYLHFGQKSTFSTCKKTSKYGRVGFMNHNNLQMSKFQDGQVTPKEGSYKIVDTPTYLLARDEDCENSFHSTADFMNMYLVMNILNLTPEQQQVMLFDSHPDGPYMELIQKAFSPGYPVIRPKNYGSDLILFRRVIFHLESPAGLIFPRVANPDPMRCFDARIFEGYRRFVLKAFNLLDVKPPAIPSVVLSLRKRSPTKNVGRVMANEDEIVNVLKEGNMMDLKIVDMAKMSYVEQLTLIRNTNVLIGIHGAGLMYIMFAADEAVLVEIHPSYRQDRHFRHASRVSGKIYLPMRATQRESCQGSSDNIFVPVEEFRKTMDGALRLARSFDDGLSECGLTCNPSILAIDRRLDSFYKSSEKRGRPLELTFPC